MLRLYWIGEKVQQTEGQETEQQDLEDFAVSIAVGGLDTIDIAPWFESHTKSG